jgi:hypothetical protein
MAEWQQRGADHRLDHHDYGAAEAISYGDESDGKRFGSVQRHQRRLPGRSRRAFSQTFDKAWASDN